MADTRTRDQVIADALRLVPEVERMACQGGATIHEAPLGDMEYCVSCDRGVRWDLVDHPVYGFTATCDRYSGPPTARGGV